jgi:hypothetical protein
MTTTYRAAYWTSADKQASVRLTCEEDAQLPDNELILVARRCASENSVDLNEGEIEIGDWTE